MSKIYPLASQGSRSEAPSGASDLFVASSVERSSSAIPSAPQPGQNLQRPSKPTISEPRKSGAPLSTAALKAKRLKALREQGKSKAPFVANTDLIDDAAKPRPCTHCDKPRLRVGPYCSEHKRQKNAEYLARKAQGDSAKRAALRTRQKAIGAQEAKAEPAAPAPRAERPTEPMRHEAIMRASVSAEIAARIASRLRWASDRIAAVAGVCLTMAYLLDAWSGRRE